MPIDDLAAPEPKLSPPSVPPQRGDLSWLERATLTMLAGRLSVPQVCQQLALSERTLDSVLRSVYRKLGVSDLDQALERGRRFLALQLPSQ